MYFFPYLFPRLFLEQPQTSLFRDFPKKRLKTDALTAPDHNRLDERGGSAGSAAPPEKNHGIRRIFSPPHTRIRSRPDNTGNWGGSGGIWPSDKTGYTKEPGSEPASLFRSLQQPGPGEQGFNLFCPSGKICPHQGGSFPPIRVDQQNRVITASQPGPDMPVRLPAEPPGPVTFHRVPEFPGQGKTDSVIIKTVPQQKKLRAAAAKASAPLKNLPNLIPAP
jgi:hypothetical protein